LNEIFKGMILTCCNAVLFKEQLVLNANLKSLRGPSCNPGMKALLVRFAIQLELDKEAASLFVSVDGHLCSEILYQLFRQTQAATKEALEIFLQNDSLTVV
jgi:hypothetical protein